MGSSTTTKRMSLDDKRNTLLALYHETKQVFTEREIVALGTKAGILSNT